MERWRWASAAGRDCSRPVAQSADNGGNRQVATQDVEYQASIASEDQIWPGVRVNKVEKYGSIIATVALDANHILRLK